VVALTVVASDGSTLRTGARGPDGDTPHYRHFGPDLTGLFSGDCGTLGIKAEITMRLIALPPFEDHASFSFPSGAALLQAMAEIARSGIAAETCAFDPGLTTVRMKRASLAADVKTLGAVVAKEKSFGKGLLAAAKIAVGGRNYIAQTDSPLHVICEGHSKAAVEHDMAQARRIASQFSGLEIENSIAKVIRAMPFPALNSMLGPTGEAWVPVHGVVCCRPHRPSSPRSRRSTPPARPRWRRTRSPLATCSPRWRPTRSLSSRSSSGPPAGVPFTNPPSSPRTWRASQRPENPAATALVTELRKEVVAIFARYGSGHFHIGRTYPYRESRDALTKSLLDAIKLVMDPHGIFNPGVLGFPPEPRP